MRKAYNLVKGAWQSIAMARFQSGVWRGHFVRAMPTTFWRTILPLPCFYGVWTYPYNVGWQRRGRLAADRVRPRDDRPAWRIAPIAATWPSWAPWWRLHRRQAPSCAAPPARMSCCASWKRLPVSSLKRAEPLTLSFLTHRRATLSQPGFNSIPARKSRRGSDLFVIHLWGATRRTARRQLIGYTGVA